MPFSSSFKEYPNKNLSIVLKTHSFAEPFACLEMFGFPYLAFTISNMHDAMKISVFKRNFASFSGWKSMVF